MRHADHLAKPAPEAQAATRRFASDVQYYLSLEPRQLPSRYLYDALGSALFEAICELPWYRVTRSELLLIRQHADAIFDRVGRISRVVELGAGSGEKLATLLSAAGVARRHPGRLDAHLIDVSAAALLMARHTLSSLPVSIVGHQASYEDGLRAFGGARGGASGRTLALFLGSNIGNFDAPAAEALLRSIRAALQTGDALLLGADLVKPEADLLLAYDDPLGVTAAFNRNLLVRINRELGGDFDVDRFAHRAVWNEEESRVEMHLVSLARQRVTIPSAALSFTLSGGETIWTESSYKFTPADLIDRLETTGFGLLEQWVDHEAGFAISLSKVL
jgi:dimethylhistidine N-methyltransferase